MHQLDSYGPAEVTFKLCIYFT